MKGLTIDEALRLYGPPGGILVCRGRLSKDDLKRLEREWEKRRKEKENASDHSI